MAYTLVATLGQSPGAITTLYDALTQTVGYSIDHIRLLHTEDREVLGALNIIKRDLKRIRPSLDVEGVSLGEDEPRNAHTLNKLMFYHLETLVSEGHSIVAGISGGRTSMGAMLMLAAQFLSQVYGVYHITVPSAVHKDGSADDVETYFRRKDEDSYQRVMHPPIDSCVLVRLPLYKLDRYLYFVRERTTYELASKPELLTYAETLDFLPQRMSFNYAARFLQILDAARSEEKLAWKTKQELSELAFDAGISRLREALDDLERLQRRGGGPLTVVEAWARALAQRNQFWSIGIEKTFLTYGNQVSIRNTDTSTFHALGLLSVHLKIIPPSEVHQTFNAYTILVTANDSVVNAAIAGENSMVTSQIYVGEGETIKMADESKQPRSINTTTTASGGSNASSTIGDGNKTIQIQGNSSSSPIDTKFKELQQAIDTLELSDTDKADAQEALSKLKEETAKGEQANRTRLERQFCSLWQISKSATKMVLAGLAAGPFGVAAVLAVEIDNRIKAGKDPCANSST